ncbi:MAG: alpha/beta fold hydrolase [Gemmatimonadaceae bacterium]
MQWRKILMSGGAALGAAAAYNHLAIRDVGPLENLVGGTEGTFRWRGHRVAYTVRGTGSPVLMVHGIHAAAFSYEWRRNVDALARGHTVYTIDLLGFGRSDRPATRYSPALFLSLLSDFARQVVRAPVALVANSLSAAYAIVLGSRDPGRFPALVLVEPVGVVRLNREPRASGDFARIAVDTPVLGTAVFNGIASHRSIRSFLETSYADNSLVTDEMVRAYYTTAHQPGAKHAPAAFIAQQLNVDVRDALRRLVQPSLLAWGEQAVQSPVEEMRGFLALKPDFEPAIFSPAGDLPHDERPTEFNDAVAAFLARAEQGGLVGA